MNHFLSLLIGSLICLPASAEIAKTDWNLVKARLTYHVHYPLKNVEGVSEGAKGKGQCTKDACQFLVAVPVADFKSGDGNRDNHMLEVTKASINPMVSIRTELPRAANLENLTLKAEVTFAGQTHTYSAVPVKTSTKDGVTTVRGQLPLLLSDFQVERPSLLGVRISNEVPVDFELSWN